MNIDVKTGGLPDPCELEKIWKDLEKRSHGGFFVSWAWIGVWLENLPSIFTTRILQAYHNGKLVGLGIIVSGKPKKIGNISYCATEHLHETGVSDVDMVIEHNDFLLDATCENEARAAMLEHWIASAERVRELSIPGTSNCAWDDRIVNEKRFRMNHIKTVMKSHAMDLQAVRSCGGDPLQLLQKKVRAKIQRALRGYRTLGELTVCRAGSVEVGLCWFKKMEILHQRRWVSKGHDGCFANDSFVNFHRMMIERNLERGGVFIIRVAVNDIDLGYIYGFADFKRAYIYQCGFDYDLVDRNSMPGLVCHVMAMGLLASQGVSVYDFMAGNSGYKSMLSNIEESMTWTHYRTVSVRFKAVAHARKIISVLRRYRSRMASAWESSSVRDSLEPLPSGSLKQAV